MGKAIINGLVVFVRFESEFVGIGEEQQTEDQEDDDKSEGWVIHGCKCHRLSASTLDFSISIMIVV